MTAVADVMTRGVRTLSPQDTVALAARTMDELNVGVIPVCEGDQLVGMVTDRDIVVRGVARGVDAGSTRLADVMSTNVRCAHENDDVDQVLGQMAETQIRRMPVVDERNSLVGIISLGDIAAKDADDEGDLALSLGDISSPAEPDRSGESAAVSADPSQGQSQSGGQGGG